MKIIPQHIEHFSFLEKEASKFIEKMHLRDYWNNKKLIDGENIALTKILFLGITLLGGFICLSFMSFIPFIQTMALFTGANLITHLILNNTKKHKQNKYYRNLNEQIRIGIEKNIENNENVFPILCLFDYFYEQAHYKNDEKKNHIYTAITALKRFLQEENYEISSNYILYLWNYYMQSMESYRGNNMLLDKNNNTKAIFEHNYYEYKKTNLSAFHDNLRTSEKTIEREKEMNGSFENLQKIL